MEFSKNFFINLGFDFEKTLKSKSEEVSFFENSLLKEKLSNSFFFYDSPNQTNTSFYLILTELSNEELIIARKYIWNEQKANLILYSPNSNTLKILYAKAAPNVETNKCILDSIEASEKDWQKIENIKRWKFDSGTFWVNYYSFLQKAKFESIDKSLVQALKSLKNELKNILSTFEFDEEKLNEIVQALIDRTLYIKYLEDNHIINSYFYNHYFDDEKLNYKTLLSNANPQKLNELFSIIHEIFNNGLFHPDTIEEKYLTQSICNAIYTSLNRNIQDKQLRLFDFQFNIIPVEFISYIYEIFLTKEQKENGIYFTPKKLAQLIIDDVIPENSIGKVLDPACGSGMFLIVAFQKLLENRTNQDIGSIEERIAFRTKLLSENIFGIEKQIIAQRFTVFSLSLQLFRGLDLDEIKLFIACQLKESKEVTLFKKYSFFENIICTNSLDLDKTPFEEKTFDYIVGNPPFFEVKQTDDEISFINKYETTIDETVLKAKNIIGKHQISQCFLLKIKDWSTQNTQFGFVSNSSNFYNDNSKDFQQFFYSNYNIGKIYELSRVKKILFEQAKENVVALIFSNKININNSIKYYPVDLGLFSEKPFKLLIIDDNTIINLNQPDLLNKTILLRDLLIGNKFDLSLINKLSTLNTLNSYITTNRDFSSFKGLDRLTNQELLKSFNIKEKLNNKELAQLHKKYALKHYLSLEKNDYHKTPYIHKPEGKLLAFSIDFDGFVNEKDINKKHFQRIRNPWIYKGEKILMNKFGNRINATFVTFDLFFSNLIYVIKLENNNLYPLFTALINSDLINYYIIQKLRSRANSNLTNVSTTSIKNIPIPKNLDEKLITKISKISQELTENQYEYNQKVAKELNDLIFDLYDLSYLEKQRIKDYFLLKSEVTDTVLEEYKSAFMDTVNIFLKYPIKIEFSSTDFGLIVAKVLLNANNSNTPNSNKTKKYILNEIFKQNPNENFVALNEKIFGKDCVYIIKKNVNLNWTETKAYEDGQEFLKRIIPNE